MFNQTIKSAKIFGIEQLIEVSVDVSAIVQMLPAQLPREIA